MAQTVKRLPAMQETLVQSLSGRSPGEGNGNPLQYSCLEKSHGQRSLAGCSPWDPKESDTTEPLNHWSAGKFLRLVFWGRRYMCMRIVYCDTKLIWSSCPSPKKFLNQWYSPAELPTSHFLAGEPRLCMNENLLVSERARAILFAARSWLLFLSFLFKKIHIYLPVLGFSYSTLDLCCGMQVL